MNSLRRGLGTVVAILVTIAVFGALPTIAEARVWTVRLDATVDGAPVAVQFDVDLADPNDSKTILLGRIPVTVSHTAERFSLSLNNTQGGECTTTVFASGTGAIQTGVGGSSASGPVTGGRVQSCGEGGVLLGYVEEYFYYYFSDIVTETVVSTPVYSTGSTVVLNAPIGGSFAATSAGATPAAQARNVTGPVSVKTPLGTGPLGAGSDLRAGVLVQTGPGGSAEIVFRDGTALSVAANTLLTLPPMPNPDAIPTLATLIGGTASIQSGGTSTPGTTHTGIKTAGVSVVPIGTQFTVQSSQTGGLHSSVIDVQSGSVDVTNRAGHVLRMLQGQRSVFEEQAPRVQLVLPVDGGAAVVGQTNTFAWTRYPGAASYLIEYTVFQSGFARANSPTVEHGPSTIGVFPGQFTDTSGLIEHARLLPTGLLPPGFHLRWRVFPLDAAGLVMPGATSSDAFLLIAQ